MPNCRKRLNSILNELKNLNEGVFHAKSQTCDREFHALSFPCRAPTTMNGH